MSKQSVNQVIQRAIGDAAFRRQLQRDPAGALSGFDLTADERAAVTSADPTRLTALGVDQRMSKAFAIGGMSASQVVTGETAGGLAPVLVDESTMTGHGALIDPGNAGSDAALISGDTASSAVLVPDAGAAATSGIVDTGFEGPTLDAGFVDDASGTATASSDVQTAGTQVDDLNQGYPGDAASSATLVPDAGAAQIEGTQVDDLNQGY